jgi:hypothetical protein
MLARSTTLLRMINLVRTINVPYQLTSAWILIPLPKSKYRLPVKPNLQPTIYNNYEAKISAFDLRFYQLHISYKPSH